MHNLLRAAVHCVCHTFAPCDGVSYSIQSSSYCVHADSKAEASGEASLQFCLQEFFQQEDITWECPGEKQAKRDLRRTSLGADMQVTSTPVASKGGSEATPGREARRTVSFSGQPDYLIQTKHVCCQ